MRFVYRVDSEGRCQAVPYPGQSQLMQLADANGLDHILYLPPDAVGPAYQYVVYLSKHAKTVLIKPNTKNPNIVEIQEAYQHALRCQSRCAYPYLRIQIIKPRHNEANLTTEAINRWCDEQIDAFVAFKYRKKWTNSKV